MSLKTKVKVGNITNLSDARYCAGMGVDMLGFRISDIEGQGISPIKFKEITDWISGPEFLIEISEAPSEAMSEKYKVDMFELPVSKIACQDLVNQKQNFIISIDLLEWATFQNDLVKNRNKIRYVLVTNSSNLDRAAIKNIVSVIAIHFSVLIGFAIDVQLLDEYLSWPIAGLALNGSEETSPGMKDYDHLSSILEKLDID